jgi:hypothetical protein
MFLQDKQTGGLVKVLDFEALIDPMADKVSVRDQMGQEEQDPETFMKQNLVFPSGENLPLCWLDANYRNR